MGEEGVGFVWAKRVARSPLSRRCRNSTPLSKVEAERASVSESGPNFRFSALRLRPLLLSCAASCCHFALPSAAGPVPRTGVHSSCSVTLMVLVELEFLLDVWKSAPNHSFGPMKFIQ